MPKNELKGWLLKEIVGVTIANPGTKAVVIGSPDLLQQFVDAETNGYWQCKAGHIRACHSLEYIQAKGDPMSAEYMPEMCGIDRCDNETFYHGPEPKDTQ